MRRVPLFTSVAKDAAMTDVQAPPRLWPVFRLSLLALVVSLLSAGTALAQFGPRVRVGPEPVKITWSRHFKDTLLTTAEPGTELVVIFTHGDRYRHLDSNWYWVQLPRDQWGEASVGWVSGRDVVPVPPAAREAARVEPPPPPVPAAEPEPIEPVRPDSADDEAMARLADAAADMDTPEIADVVVNFAFDSSTLTDDGKAALADVATLLANGASGLAIVLQGHADSTGPEPYNQRLGQARAEAVRTYLADEHGIATDRMSVISFGESRPAASNDTPEGRAVNRRVVLSVDPDSVDMPSASAVAP